MRVSRPWGIWTKQKLDVLSEYLDAFTTASKFRARGTTVYLDLFAGEAQNRLQLTGTRIEGSPIRALRAEPHLTKVVLFELPAKAASLKRELRLQFPNRDIRVWPGDCNDTIDAALAELVQQDMQWAPTFAFIDQQGPDIQWETLQKLASHKRGSRFKTELWMFFGHALLPRGLGIREPNEGFALQVDAMLGTTAWRKAYEARRCGDLTPQAFRDELLNWMRWQLETELGYKWTHVFEIFNTRGQAIYAMVFATDNEAGNKIMSSVYGLAAQAFPHMLAEAVQLRDEALGNGQQLSWDFGDRGAFDPKKLYVHTPPRPPYGLQSDDVGSA